MPRPCRVTRSFVHISYFRPSGFTILLLLYFCNIFFFCVSPKRSLSQRNLRSDSSLGMLGKIIREPKKKERERKNLGEKKAASFTWVLPRGDSQTVWNIARSYISPFCWFSNECFMHKYSRECTLKQVLVPSMCHLDISRRKCSKRVVHSFALLEE